MKPGSLAASLALAVILLALPSATTVSAVDGGDEPTASDTTGTWAEFRGNLNNTGYSIARVPPSNRVFLELAVGQPFHSSPIVDDDLLYFGSDGGKVHAVNLTTGREDWNYSTGSAVWASALVVGDRVFIGSMDSYLYALDRTSGGFLWRFLTNDSIVSSAKYVDGTLVFGSKDGSVYFVNATTGREDAPPFATGGQIWGTPAVVNGTIVIGSNTGNVSRIRLSDHIASWNFTRAPQVPEFVKYSSAAVHAGRAFIGSDDRNVYAVDLETGGLVWSFQTGAPVYASPAVHGNRVFVHSTDGELYALPFDDPNRDGAIGAGEVLWQFHTGDGVFGEGGSSPAVADGRVLVATRSGDVFCIDEQTGQQAWRFTAPAANLPSFSSPALVDGQVFVGLSDGTMYGFSEVAAGMSVAIEPEMTVIESQRAMQIVFNVTYRGQPVEGAFVTFTVSAGILEQNSATTLADGKQRVKYLAPSVGANSTVRITATAAKYGLEDASSSATITVTPAHDYGTPSGEALSWDKYQVFLAAIAILIAANTLLYTVVILRRRRRPSS